MTEPVTDKRKAAPYIANIEKHCFSSPWSENQILSSDDNTVFYIAKQGEKVIGYAGMYMVLNEGYVTNIGVLPEYRKKGIGKELMERLIDLSKEKNLSFLSLEVRKTNTPAIKLYTSFEFQNVGIRKNFYTNPKEDAIIMTRFFK